VEHLDDRETRKSGPELGARSGRQMPNELDAGGEARPHTLDEAGGPEVLLDAGGGRPG